MGQKGGTFQRPTLFYCRSYQPERSLHPVIKLIACDIDGTLIPYGQSGLPRGLFPLIRALKEKGILFCPASGRQYHSLRRLFAPVADEVCFLCENGAVIFGVGTEETAPVLSKTVMPRRDALALARDILACPQAEMLVSGENTSYVCQCGPELERDLSDRLGNHVVRVDRPEAVTEEIIKVSAFCPRGTDGPAKALGKRWGEPYHMAVAGPDWLDFTVADKGTGITGLCTALGIDLADVAAFGDNWNDLAMLRAVGHPYLMSTADPKLKALIPQQCDAPLPVLQAILEA